MTTPFSVRRGLGLLLAGVLALATACTAGTPTPAPTPTAGGPAQRDIGERDRSDLQPGGTLRRPVSSVSGPWNPLLTGSGSPADVALVTGPLLPRFFRYDAAGVPTPDPDFLVSVTQTAADPTTITYVLNPKAVWGDGSPVDGDDLIATWRACNGRNTAFRCARTDAFSRIANITTGADKFTVTVTFTGVYPDWTGVFDDPGVLRSESVVDPQTFNDGWGRLNNDWLSGPFRFDAADTGAGVLTAVPNDRWWGTTPLLRQLLWRVVPTADRASAYADHRLDTYAVDPADHAQAARTAGTTVRAAAGTEVREVVLNTGSGPLTDQTLRQAVGRAVDRTALATADLNGTDWPAAPPGNHLFLPAQAGYADHSDGSGFDLAKAQADLDAAGWVTGADGFRAKDGTVLTLDVLADGDDPTSTAEGRLLTTQLAAAGIRSQLQTASGDFSDRLTGGRFTLAVRGRDAGRSPYAVMSTYTGTGAGNVSRLSLPDYDALAGRAATQTDPTQRAATANEADVVLWAAVPTLPLLQAPDFVAVPSTLANYGAFGLSSVDYTAIGYRR